MNSTLTRILCVEDEPDIRAVARLALESVGGFTVAVCSSGQEAIDTLASFKPDLVLLDVMMPGMDGPSTLEALRRLPAGGDVPVIFMTAKVQPKELEHYRQLGAWDAIPKPFDPMTLSNAIRDIWNSHHA